MLFYLFAVELPPIKSETGTGKVFTVDQSNGTLDKDEKELKSRLNIEVNILIQVRSIFTAGSLQAKSSAASGHAPPPLQKKKKVL